MKYILASLVLIVTLCAPMQAQRSARQNFENEPPVQNKFPGTGSYDQWKASVPLFEQGMAATRKRQWDQAINAFKASLDQYPYQWRAWMHIGHAIEEKGGNVSDAEAAYRSALKLQQNSWRPWKDLANVLYVQKRYPEAREALTNAMALRPPEKAHSQMAHMLESIDSAEHNAATPPATVGAMPCIAHDPPGR